jgi:hypothetical protein
MGSYIHLYAGRIQLDWGKNNGFINHSGLFLPSDKKKVPYYYADNVTVYKPGYSSPLSRVKGRLEMLGYAWKRLEALYENYLDEVHIGDGYIPFGLLVVLLPFINLNAYKKNREYVEEPFANFLFEQLSQLSLFKDFQQSERLTNQSIVEFISYLDPLILLRILAENQKNQKVKIVWQTADIISGGWAKEQDLAPLIHDHAKTLIVTEGSSDTFIISKAIQILKPDIADFFRFVDMEENYPFTGTGNLYKFCQGLVSIQIQNKILVIFDNDVEGNDKYNKTIKLKLPEDMKAMILPNHKDFDNFKTIGPSGETIENINGKAVAIECFLDFNFTVTEPPKIRWTNYVKEYGCYQGSLENKDSFVRQFKSVKNISDNYDFSKLEFLVKTVLDVCT